METWQIIVTILGLLIAAITAFGVFYGPRLVAKSQGRKESLRNHFKDLETIVIKPVSDIMRGIENSRGTLSIKGTSYGSRSYDSLTTNFERGEFYIFKLHFPDQAGKATKLIGEVNEHNEFSESFTNNLKELVKEKTSLPIREGTGRPFVYPDVAYYLRQTLIDLKEGTSPRHDFRNAEIEKQNDFWHVRTVSNIYAEVTTEEEANSCKRGLIELMGSTLLIEEISYILKRATQLENESKSTADLLDRTCRQYGVGQLLNKEKDCPYCQVIFHKKRESKNLDQAL